MHESVEGRAFLFRCVKRGNPLTDFLNPRPTEGQRLSGNDEGFCRENPSPCLVLELSSFTCRCVAVVTTEKDTRVVETTLLMGEGVHVGLCSA